MNITAHHKKIQEIFTNVEQYYIPTYQRPYAWGQEQTDDLLQDMIQAFSEDPNSDYFLGCIILVEHNEPRIFYDVVDGQQRLTTLILLLYVLKQRFIYIDSQNNEDKEKYRNAIEYCNGRITVQRAFCINEPRVIVREQDQDFMNRYIYGNASIEELEQANVSNESKEKLRDNSVYLSKQVKNFFKDDFEKLANFVTFLMEKCTIVKVIASSRSVAYKIFSTINNRGLDLSHADILKAEIVGDNEQLSKKWEELETDMGRDSFLNFLHILRLVLTKEKAQKDLVDELEQHWRLDKITPKEKKFIFEECIVPYSVYYRECSEISFQSDSEKDPILDTIKQYLSLLSYAGENEWIAAIMEYRRVNNKLDLSKLLKFVVDIERKVAFNLLTGKTHTQRTWDFCTILKEFTSTNTPKIEFNANEKKEMLEIIKGDVYKLPTVRKKYLMLKLSTLYDKQQLFRNFNYATIEHILPQTPTSEEWLNRWSDSEQREQWTHKLGNLTLLSRKSNSKAKNYPYNKKIEAYFLPDCIFTMTCRLAVEYKTWNPHDLEKRHNECIKKLRKSWGI